MDFMISDLVANADVHKSLLGGGVGTGMPHAMRGRISEIRNDNNSH